MKNFYYAVLTVDENEKQLSFVKRVSESENLLHSLCKIKNVLAVTACDSKKRAAEITAAWNMTAQKNGRYIYGDFGKYDFFVD